MLTRRTAIIGAPAASVIATAPALAEPESEIMRLFAVWDELSRRPAPGHLSSAEQDDWSEARCVDLDKIEASIQAIPPRTLQELAAKVLAASMGGEMGLSDEMVAEAERFAGIAA